MTIRRILVGWDGSDPSDSALRVAIAYVQEFGGEVEALAVFEKRGDEHVDDEELAAPERRDVREKFAVRFGDGTVVFHAVADAASPARVLARVAKDQGFDLIAVGCRAPGERRDGDQTVHELAVHAAVPLLVVEDDQDEVTA
jgi:nucleotide-binding universal stress UspA family protein